MTFRGYIQGDHVVLGQNHGLPDGTVVDVRPPAARGTRKKPGSGHEKAVDPALRLHELAFDTGFRDLADQHDHYIYGKPKHRAVRPSARKKPARKKSR